MRIIDNNIIIGLLLINKFNHFVFDLLKAHTEKYFLSFRKHIKFILM